MFQTGRVAVMMSQDLESKLGRYYLGLQERYTPHVVASAVAEEVMEQDMHDVVSTMAEDHRGQYETARSRVRDNHKSRFAQRQNPCK